MINQCYCYVRNRTRTVCLTVTLLCSFEIWLFVYEGNKMLKDGNVVNRIFTMYDCEIPVIQIDSAEY